METTHEISDKFGTVNEHGHTYIFFFTKDVLYISDTNIAARNAQGYT
jgi:hypothetical protein